MSQENVDTFRRAVVAYNSRDVEALVAEAHPDIEWRPAILMKLSGTDTVYRGHEGVRQLMRDIDDTLAEIHVEFPEVRDLGDRTVAIGRLRARGKESGAETESPWGAVGEFKNGKAIWLRTYLDPSEAVEAAGLEE